MRKLPYFGFYGFIGILVFLELFFANTYILANLPAQAQSMGITSQRLAFRIILLSILDFIALFGAFEACVAIYNNNKEQLMKAGITAFVGFGLYGIYQLLSAWIYLPESYKLPMAVYGILYFFLGLFSFILSRKYVKDRLEKDSVMPILSAKEQKKGQESKKSKPKKK